MADEDHTFAFLPQLMYDLKQTLGLQVGEGRGRLVQHQQLRPPVQGLEDFNALLRAHGDLGDGLIQLHIQPVALRQLKNFLFPRLSADENTLGMLVPQNDVFKDRHGLHQHEMLMHHADAQPDGLGRGIDFHPLALEINAAGRGLIQTEQDIHQRAFARSVFSQQSVNLASLYAPVDVPVGVNLAETLGNVLHSQDFFHKRGLSPLVMFNMPKCGPACSRMPRRTETFPKKKKAKRGRFASKEGTSRRCFVMSQHRAVDSIPFAYLLYKMRGRFVNIAI
ncbi:hypothetical protein SDC9_102522 [bioreactor metagenome]|uniref:Uncharacterized protein n=1 Tax=bioreactor metagenome TaxID=1076179 RepID=A0A645AR35_9ZZZZ